MLSENGRLRIANENFAKANFKLKSLVAKYERVARAARDASTGPCLLVHESCLFFDGTNDSCPACRLIAALADLGALGG